MSEAFKVGDRVTALPGEPSGPTETDASVPCPSNVGKTGVVVRVCNVGLDVDFPDGTKDYARFAYWAKAVPATPFAPGDVVTLKSGGPKMTVERVIEDDVECTWHLVSGEALGAVYAPEALCRK
jgi:uncharacterized protein YodC (DUF2158 family)